MGLLNDYLVWVRKTKATALNLSNLISQEVPKSAGQKGSTSRRKGGPKGKKKQILSEKDGIECVPIPSSLPNPPVPQTPLTALPTLPPSSASISTNTIPEYFNLSHLHSHVQERFHLHQCFHLYSRLPIHFPLHHHLYRYIHLHSVLPLRHSTITNLHSTLTSIHFLRSMQFSVCNTYMELEFEPAMDVATLFVQTFHTSCPSTRCGCKLQRKAVL